MISGIPGYAVVSSLKKLIYRGIDQATMKVEHIDSHFLRGTDREGYSSFRVEWIGVVLFESHLVG
jgi:hypothetical protein